MTQWITKMARTARAWIKVHGIFFHHLGISRNLGLIQNICLDEQNHLATQKSFPVLPAQTSLVKQLLTTLNLNSWLCSMNEIQQMKYQREIDTIAEAILYRCLQRVKRLPVFLPVFCVMCLTWAKRLRHQTENNWTKIGVIYTFQKTLLSIKCA